jgi:hypothetical protein
MSLRRLSGHRLSALGCPQWATSGRRAIAIDKNHAYSQAWTSPVTALLARRPTKIAAIALANKLARMAWAMMARNERYKEPAALAA